VSSSSMTPPMCSLYSTVTDISKPLGKYIMAWKTKKQAAIDGGYYTIADVMIAASLRYFCRSFACVSADSDRVIVVHYMPIGERLAKDCRPKAVIRTAYSSLISRSIFITQPWLALDWNN